MTGFPDQDDCYWCTHSSDVHAYPVFLNQPYVTVTESATRFPCLKCECPTFISSESRIRALIGSGGTSEEPPPNDETPGEWQ